MPLQIPYRHLVSVVQIADSFEGVLEILKRTERVESIEPQDRELLRQRVECVRFWLDNWAPEEVKFKVLPVLPTAEISAAEVTFLRAIHSSLQAVEWNGDKIHDVVYETAKASGLSTKVGFQVLYLIFINRKQGPRLGFFLSTMDRKFVLDRIQEAYEAGQHRL